MNLAHVRGTLEGAGVVFAPGLTAEEVDRAELAYRLTFPPDLRDFVMFALPVSPQWPNWREVDDPSIRGMLTAPYEGIAFDIEHNVFWDRDWGERPVSLEHALAVAKRHVEAAPTLIPVRGHRYLPSRPHEAGNPVFSVHQTDIIHYGTDLSNYLENEFHHAFGTPEYVLAATAKRIDFWSDFVEGAD